MQIVSIEQKAAGKSSDSFSDRSIIYPLAASANIFIFEPAFLIGVDGENVRQ